MDGESGATYGRGICLRDVWTGNLGKNLGTFRGSVRLPDVMTPSRALSTACLAAGLLFPVTAFAAGWTDWVSEEGGSPAAVCGIWEAARGFDCRGDYCDDVRLYCDSLPFGISVGSYSFTPFFSEEDLGSTSWSLEGWYGTDNDYSEVCYAHGAAGILTGIRCSGSYCDNISLECAIPRTFFEGVWEPVEYASCYWTGEYSEEDPPFYSPYGQFITGVECIGAYCNNKSYYVCIAQPAANSCEGSCGGQARGGCFCDAQCSSFGDCCSDEASVC